MGMSGTVMSWNLLPPPERPGTFACLMEPGSLTDRLIATGRAFGVVPLRLGEDAAAPDEARLLGIGAGEAMIVRHVALTLDGERVVMARSFCRRACPAWFPILDRGGRSLGFTLFSGEVELTRRALEFTTVGAGHPLFALGQEGEAAQSYPARRCRFEMQGAPMVVCEVFLPRLERSLATAPGRGIP
jgi:chorismate--pyruvate lyase